MPNNIMQSTLLVDLSVEQEEGIAGGLTMTYGNGISLSDLAKTAFSEEKLASISTVKSGKGGSEVSRVIAAEKTKTYAEELFGIKL